MSYKNPNLLNTFISITSKYTVLLWKAQFLVSFFAFLNSQIDLSDNSFITHLNLEFTNELFIFITTINIFIFHLINSRYLDIIFISFNFVFNISLYSLLLWQFLLHLGILFYSLLLFLFFIRSRSIELVQSWFQKNLCYVHLLLNWIHQGHPKLSIF